MNLLYEPSAWQTRFHNAPHWEVLGAGSQGPGKTTAMMHDPFQQIVVEHQRCANKAHPQRLEWGASVGWALYMRRSSPMLDHVIKLSKKKFKRYDPGAVYNENSKTWTFSSGYQWTFGHCHDLMAYESYLSDEYTWLGFDELIQFDQEQYDQISLRVRTTDPVLMPMMRIRATSNPRTSGSGFRVKNPQWVREYFVEPAPAGNVTLRREVVTRDGEKKWLDRIYLPAQLYDNPDKVFVATQEVKLLAKPEHIRLAYLKGDWFTVVGSFFSDFRVGTHTCAPFRLPLEKGFRFFRSMDWGYRTDGCVHWWMLDPDDTLFCVRELMFRGLEPKDVAKRVVEIEKELGLTRKPKSILTGPADTQLWESRGDSGIKKVLEFQRAGVGWVQANKKSRQRNAERLQMRISSQDGLRGRPRFVVFDTCAKMILHLPAIMPDPDNDSVPDEEYTEDHVIDSALYAVEYAERRVTRVPLEDRLRDSNRGREPSVYERQRTDRGVYGYG
jgi:hypothetical protein